MLTLRAFAVVLLFANTTAEMAKLELKCDLLDLQKGFKLFTNQNHLFEIILANFQLETHVLFYLIIYTHIVIWWCGVSLQKNIPIYFPKILSLQGRSA